MKAVSDKTSIFMTMVYTVAQCSKDERTKIGAVIVDPEGIIRSTGYNGFPRGINDLIQERQEKPEKHHWFEHAERNAIFNAARVGVSINGCTMYTQGIPCQDCARAVIQAGIKKVIVHKPWNDQNSSDKYNYHISKQMFMEAVVEIEQWDGILLSPKGFRRGELVLNSIDYIKSK